MMKKLIVAVLSLSGLGAPLHLYAQLRPLDPPLYRAFDGNANVFLTVGASSLSAQRASLAGTQGTLTELGVYSITWRTGRVALSASGTAFWKMSNEKQVEPALNGVEASHKDAGPVILETDARLSPNHAALLWLLRFGMQLPTTSFRSGLERDEADVFATLGVRTQKPLWLAAELGTAINGKPEPLLGQTDVVVYSLGAGYRGRRMPVIPELWVVGHDDVHSRRYRGNEDLSELRASLRTRGKVWIGAQYIHGLREFSPDNGVRITIGTDAHLSEVPLLGWR
jgi:hypothetical protein